jgi:hypothetical protein
MQKPHRGIPWSNHRRVSQHFEPTVDVWNDPATSLKLPQKPATSPSAELEPGVWRLASNGSVKKVKNEVSKLVSTQSIKESLHDIFLNSEYNPAIMAHTLESQDPKFQPPPKPRIEKPNTPNRQAVPSIIFENSPKAPITIILTTPEDEGPAESSQWHPSHEQKQNPFNEIRNVRNSPCPLPPTKPLANASTTPLPVQSIDKTLLMPPTEHLLDTRRTRKAQEFREIRSFKIDFMNMKGDTFPKQLRSQMMGLYGIKEADLHLETVAKFNSMPVVDKAEGEGVALDDNRNSKEHLRILETAFRSRMEEVTPKRNTAPVRPQPTPKQNPGPKKLNLRSQSETSMPTFVADDDSMPLAWLGPVISSDVALSPHSPTKTRSTHNLHRCNTTITPTEEHGKQFQELDRTSVRRTSRFSGVFSVMREAMLGRRRSENS